MFDDVNTALSNDYFLNPCECFNENWAGGFAGSKEKLWHMIKHNGNDMPTMLILGNLWISLANVFRFRIRSRRYLGKDACWCSAQKLWIPNPRHFDQLHIESSVGSHPGSNNKFRPPSVDILMGGASCEPHNLISVSRTADDKDFPHGA